MSKLSRNAPCFCGSGRKFKKCHERNSIQTTQTDQRSHGNDLPRTGLIGMSAHWHDDRPEGLAVVIRFDTPEEGRRWKVAMDKALKVYDANATREEIEEQLESMAQNKKQTLNDPESTYLAILNINWLEQRGYLKPDEHNGLSWAERGDDYIRLIRGDAPSVEQLEAAMPDRLVERQPVDATFAEIVSAVAIPPADRN